MRSSLIAALCLFGALGCAGSPPSLCAAQINACMDRCQPAGVPTADPAESAAFGDNDRRTPCEQQCEQRCP